MRSTSSKEYKNEMKLRSVYGNTNALEYFKKANYGSKSISKCCASQQCRQSSTIDKVHQNEKRMIKYPEINDSDSKCRLEDPKPPDSVVKLNPQPPKPTKVYKRPLTAPSPR